MTDTDGRILVWNEGAERLYGWRSEEVTGAFAATTLLGTDAGECAAMLHAIAGGEVWTGTCRMRRRERPPVEVRARLAPIRHGGEVVAVLVESTPAQGTLEDRLAALRPGEPGDPSGRLGKDWYRSFLLASRRALSTSALDEVLAGALASLATALGAGSVSLLLVSHDGGDLVLRADSTSPGPPRCPLRLPPGAGLSGKVLARNEPLVVGDLDEEPVAGALLRKTDCRSYVGVPLVGVAYVAGVLCATSSEPGRFSASHAEALSLVASPMASALERVSLLEAERRARQRAERNARRLAALHALGASLAARQSLPEICESTLVEGVEVAFPDAYRRIWVWQERELRLVASAGGPGCEPAELPASERPLAEAAAMDDGPLFFASPAELAEAWPGAQSAGVRALAVVPLRAGSETVGLLEIRLAAEHAFTRAERSFLLSVAGLAGTSIARAQAAEEDRRAAAVDARWARTLLEAIAPAGVPRVDGLELWGRYQPADAGAIGGDWYDVFTLPDGRVAIVVGDVAGHGLEAVTSMVVLRNALFAFALESGSPAEVLERLQALVSDAPGSWPELATIGLGFCDPHRRQLVTASAGHVPFARVGARDVEFHAAVDPPLARSFTGGRFVERTVAFEPGELAVFYTDGLIEVRGEPLGEGLARLAITAMEHHDEPLPAVAEAILDGTSVAPRGDDFSLLLVRFTDGTGRRG